jgi:protein Tex
MFRTATGESEQRGKMVQRHFFESRLHNSLSKVENSIREQSKLDDALEAAILAADSKGRLEDIYLPFKPKRRTKAEIAKETGLEPLADLLLAKPEHDPMVAAAPFVDAGKQVRSPRTALLSVLRSQARLNVRGQ